ncbi:MAG TPA: glycosyltransferase [Acidimicrobiales bacterium]|nr:glycosyltransferase [Acidimicrobiales bacterium]
MTAVVQQRDEEHYDVVVPTVGRPSLRQLLDALADQRRTLPGRVFLVDDRPAPSSPLLNEGPPPGLDVIVVRGGGAGPAAARNAGWRAASAPWVAFLDDDVMPGPEWSTDLAADLRACSDDVAAVQGRIRVPLPIDRRPTDWERNVAGLEAAAWATADMAYRRPALVRLGGFDERFPRAYREDADLALRAMDAGYQLRRGRRQITHPVLAAPWNVSLAKQAGNADDALMDRVHGRGWRERAQAPAGAFRHHVGVTAAGAGAVLLVVSGGGRARRTLVMVTATTWVAGTARFAWRRIAPGPRTPREVAAMAVTSALIPPAALWHRARGWWGARGAAPWPAAVTAGATHASPDGDAPAREPAAVAF